MCQLQREGKNHAGEMKKRDTNANQNQIGSAHLQHYPWHIPGPLVQRSTSAGEEEVGSYTQLHAKELARVLLKAKNPSIQALGNARTNVICTALVTPSCTNALHQCL